MPCVVTNPWHHKLNQKTSRPHTKVAPKRSALNRVVIGNNYVCLESLIYSHSIASYEGTPEYVTRLLELESYRDSRADYSYP